MKQIFILLLFCCTIRLYFFSGFVLGDDPAYASLSSQIINGSYPEIGDKSVFATRPLLLYMISLSTKIFGFNDFGYVMPVFLASILNMILIFIAASKLADKRAGLIASIIFILFPLDVILSTTMSNDILMASMIWGSGCILLMMFKNNNLPSKFYLYLSGFLLGISISVKTISLIYFPLFIFVIFLISGKGLIRLRNIVVYSIGWTSAFIIQGIFYIFKTGDFLSSFHTEFAFNNTYIAPSFIRSAINLKSFLFYYPNLLFGLSKNGFAGHQFLPYGYLFYFILLSLFLSFFNTFRSVRIPLFFSLSAILIMNFAPLSISPYIPIHRLPRFLYPALIPGIVAVGIMFSRLYSLKNKYVKHLGNIALLIIFVASSFWSLKAASFYKNCSLDQKYCWEVIKNTKIKKIYTDQEMVNYLLFKWAYNPPVEISSNIPDQIQEESLFILGGSRNPDLDPHIPFNYMKKITEKIKLTILLENKLALKPWRLERMKIFYHPGKSELSNTSSLFPYNAFKNLTEKIWEIDVGNPVSEALNKYQCHSLTWKGTRKYLLTDNTFASDDGIAHREYEIFMIDNININKPLYIIKRYDPSIINQEVKVFFNEIFIGNWKFPNSKQNNCWADDIFIIKQKFLSAKGLLKFQYSSSSLDINSFHYWLFQVSLP